MSEERPIRDQHLPTRGQIAIGHRLLERVERLIPGEWTRAQKIRFTELFVGLVAEELQHQADNEADASRENLISVLGQHPKWQLQMDALEAKRHSKGDFQRLLVMDYSRVIRAVEADLKALRKPKASTHFEDYGQYYEARRAPEPVLAPSPDEFGGGY